MGDRRHSLWLDDHCEAHLVASSKFRVIQEQSRHLSGSILWKRGPRGQRWPYSAHNVPKSGSQLQGGGGVCRGHDLGTSPLVWCTGHWCTGQDRSNQWRVKRLPDVCKASIRGRDPSRLHLAEPEKVTGQVMTRRSQDKP